MKYYELVNGEYLSREFDQAPPELQGLLTDAKYSLVIEYHSIDRADDNSDAGMGYDYSNSYYLYLEPDIERMIVSDGRLYAYMCDPQRRQLLPMIPGERLEDWHYCSPRYKDGVIWRVLADPERRTGRIGFIPVISGEPSSFGFPEGLVGEVLRKLPWEDQRGYPTGRYQVWVSLTDKAMEDRESALRLIAESAGVKPIPAVKYLDEPK